MIAIIILGWKKLFQTSSFQTLATSSLRTSVAAIPELKLDKSGVSVHAVVDYTERPAPERCLVITMACAAFAGQCTPDVVQLLSGIVLCDVVAMLTDAGVNYGHIAVCLDGDPASSQPIFWINPTHADPANLRYDLQVLDNHLQRLGTGIQALDGNRKSRKDKLDSARSKAKLLRDQVASVIDLHDPKRALQVYGAKRWIHNILLLGLEHYQALWPCFFAQPTGNVTSAMIPGSSAWLRQVQTPGPWCPGVYQLRPSTTVRLRNTSGDEL